MPYHLKVSNSLKRLSEDLSTSMQAFEGSVFDPIYIVTQTEGMNKWLNIRIAEQAGIAANIQYLKPNDLITKIYYLLGGTFAQMLSGRNLEWLLYQQLGDANFIQKHPKVAEYYINKNEKIDLKRISLASVVADLFDQYQIYRPDMIDRWNNGVFSDPEESWQMDLWQSLNAFTDDLFIDKIAVSNFIKHALQEPNKVQYLQRSMPSVHLFGISVITEFHLDILECLSQFIHIHFFILNPAPEDYWFEDKSPKMLAFLKRIGKAELNENASGNQLLSSWGKIIRDTFGLLFKDEALINAYDSEFVERSKDERLLNKIQHLIAYNQPIEKDFFSEENLSDGSLTISSCLSPAREVEVLYNYLVHLVDQKKQQLSSRDILVMVSDIDAYSSYIRAVFDHAPYSFEYTIADDTYTASDSISHALLSLLTLSEATFTSENIVQLLDFKDIRANLGIEDVALIRRVVDEANIRFGFRNRKEDETYLVSWKYGMQRIMYGITMQGEDLYKPTDEAPFFPLDILESRDTLQVIRFVHFVNKLISLIEQRITSRSIAGWVEYVRMTLELFIDPEKEIQNEDYQAVLQQLAHYNEVNSLINEKIEYVVFLQAFQAQLASTKRNSTFAGEGITFCSMIPMRSIPFKVVAMLGLNGGTFPRKEDRVDFDLMQKEKRRGDRNRKENDKHLFLETINSAQDFLYLSYIGQNAQDHSALPASVLVDELLDFITEGSSNPDVVRDQLITKHPIHRFSRVYSSNDHRYYTYLLNSGKPLVNLTNPESNTTDINITTIELQKLYDFVKEPVKYYYNNVLNINYNSEANYLREVELINLDSLQKWKLKKDLMNGLIVDDQSCVDALKMKGSLPLENWGEAVFLEISDNISSIISIYKELVNDEPKKKIPVDLSIGEFRLVGEVQNMFGENLIHVSVSSSDSKYQLVSLIDHLILSAMGINHHVYFISHGKKKSFSGTKLTSENAMILLSKIIDLFRKGNSAIIPYHPKLKPSKNTEYSIEEYIINVEKYVYPKYESSPPCPYLKKYVESKMWNPEHDIETVNAFVSVITEGLNDLYPSYFSKSKK